MAHFHISKDQYDKLVPLLAGKPDTPLILYPVNESGLATGLSFDLSFPFSHPFGETMGGCEYVISLEDQSVVVEGDKTTNTPSVGVTLTANPSNPAYFAKVRVCDINNVWSDWSPLCKFWVLGEDGAGNQTGSPKILVPTSNATVMPPYLTTLKGTPFPDDLRPDAWFASADQTDLTLFPFLTRHWYVVDRLLVPSPNHVLSIEAVQSVLTEQYLASNGDKGSYPLTSVLDFNNLNPVHNGDAPHNNDMDQIEGIMHLYPSMWRFPKYTLGLMMVDVLWTGPSSYQIYGWDSISFVLADS
jgi:hypothetical protein